MAVRVKIEIDVGENSTTVSGKLNTGYTPNEIALVLPLLVAEQLGIWPNLPKNVEEITYGVAGGGKIKVYRIQKCGNIRLLAKEDVIVKNCSIVISEGEDEILISDKLISALGIVIEDAGKGLWRLRGETEIRESEQPEFFS